MTDGTRGRVSVPGGIGTCVRVTGVCEDVGACSDSVDLYYVGGRLPRQRTPFDLRILFLSSENEFEEHPFDSGTQPLPLSPTFRTSSKSVSDLDLRLGRMVRGIPGCDWWFLGVTRDT